MCETAGHPAERVKRTPVMIRWGGGQLAVLSRASRADGAFLGRKSAHLGPARFIFSARPSVRPFLKRASCRRFTRGRLFLRARASSGVAGRRRAEAGGRLLARSAICCWGVFNERARFLPAYFFRCERRIGTERHLALGKASSTGTQSMPGEMCRRSGRPGSGKRPSKRRGKIHRWRKKINNNNNERDAVSRALFSNSESASTAPVSRAALDSEGDPLLIRAIDASLSVRLPNIWPGSIAPT